MDVPEEGKRSGLLALAVLGVLLVAVLTVFTVFDGDEGSGGGGAATPAATAGGQDAANSATGSGGSQAPSGGATPIVALTEVAAAHEVMAKYMAGLSTYDHTSKSAAWSAPLLRLTTGDTQMEQVTALPTGKEWARCEADQCSSTGTATVVRDAMISDDLVRDSGRSISSVVNVTAARTADGKTVTESNKWLVTVKEESGAWVVSGFDIFGLGDVGASDESGE
ncbi:hypothetical protein [Streptomyces sp. NBC_01235]|uniref:hypothetical protein n=1 Tax=Streptomyces sp. NBC_01235 TaxID=2903788 RepID=UPI002E111EA7|nr:hypothetical protein OG289_27565 [Streptomyces sp. NBC_01235]